MFQRLERIRATMRQYTDEIQTAKLMELGVEKPKSISGYCQRGPYEYDAETNTKMVVYDDTQYPIYAYSIGELIEMLNSVSELEITHFGSGSGWDVYDELRACTGEELIDALYDMIIMLKEKGVI